VEGEFYTPLSPFDWSFRPKINKETLELNDTIDQMDVADVYRVFHPALAQVIFFTAAMKLSPITDHI
jgi:hypothetical protein